MVKGSSILILFSFTLVCSGCFNVKNSADFRYQKLDSDKYLLAIDNTPVNNLVDVRTAKEFSSSHINGAMNISLLNFNFRNKVKKFDRQIPIFVYCQTCHRSPIAARKLKKMGFKWVYDLKGGYKILVKDKVN